MVIAKDLSFQFFCFVIIMKKNKLDPLDEQGKDGNLFTKEAYSKSYKEYAKMWANLPLYTNKTELSNLLASIKENQITLLISGTGSGKTVLVPKFLLKYFIDNATEKIKIAITNPKTLTTIYNADFAAKTLDIPLGSYVGYRYRGSPENMTSDNTQLLYMTDGLLLAQITKGDVLLSEYSGIIIDEAHERQVPIDMLMFYLKHVLKNRPEFKLIIMSATIDAEIFRRFYESDGIKFNTVLVSGQSNQPIESIYLKENDKINMFNYMDVGISIIIKILDETTTGDILMFVTTQKETEIGCKKLAGLCKNKVRTADVCDEYYCAEVYGKMPEDKKPYAVDASEYKKINKRFKRKVIFATNVAESSITIDGIVYVVDAGLEFFGYFDYNKYANVMEKRYITKAQVKQRMGRAGRTKPGVCYHLYSESKFNSLADFPSPAIATSNLVDTFLSLIKTQKYMSDAIKVARNLITPMSEVQISGTIKFLHFHNLIKILDIDANQQSQSGGVIDDIVIGETYNFGEQRGGEVSYIPYPINYNKLEKYEGTTTSIGNIMNEMIGYPIELCLLALYGKLFGVPALIDMAAICAACESKVDNLLNNKPEIATIFPDATMHYSDHLFAYFLLVNYFERNKNVEYLNTKVFEKANEIKTTFTKALDRINEQKITNIIEKYYKQVETTEFIDNFYIGLASAFKFNTFELTDSIDRIEYKTKYYNEPTTASVSFQSKETMTPSEANEHKMGICSSVLNIMNKTLYQFCTLIPNKYMSLII